MNVHHYHREATPSKAGVAACTKCGQQTYVMPLHDDRGGPLFCFMCAGAWHAEHAPKRRARRLLIKAMKAYSAVGGDVLGKGFDELRLAASGFASVREADDVGFGDLTTELLAATIALTHPDKHPVERKAEANRVTQELLALKPFVFPAPPPKEPEPPEPPAKTEPDNDGCLKDGDGCFNDLSRLFAFPCEDCRDAQPDFYCDPCKAQLEKKQQEESKREEKKRQQKNARQRQLYKLHTSRKRHASNCLTCGKTFKPKRRDAQYCSAVCRQRAYVKRDGKPSNSKPVGREHIERTIMTVFTTDPDNAYTTNDLCHRVYLGLKQIELKHRAAVIPIAKKVCEQLETWDWWKSEERGAPLVFRKSCQRHVLCHSAAQVGLALPLRL